MKREPRQSSAERFFSHLALAEIYLMEAGIESAMTLHEGLHRARRSLAPGDEWVRESLAQVYRETREQALESFAVRYQHLRKVWRDEDRR